MVVGELSQERELVIIGGGPGGYTAAIRAAQLGLSVTLIEQADMGGVCLHQGCIPSKVFTHAARKRSEIDRFEELGIDVCENSFNIQKLLVYKTKVIEDLKLGIENLCRENRIEVIRGKASFLSIDRIGVENGHQFDIYKFEQIIIATGSSPVVPLDLKGGGTSVLLADEIFKLQTVPKHLIVIGQDYIALEVASSFAALGSKISILIARETPQELDESIKKELERLFKRRKISIIKDAVILSTAETDEGVLVTYNTNNKDDATISGSHLYSSGVRKPNVESVGISRMGIGQTEEGFIKINENMESSIPSIYAVGDVTEGPLLAVKAIKQGKTAVEAIAGGKPEVDLTFIPVVVHSIPPIASVGLTEQNIRELELKVRISQFSLRGNGYAAITNKKEGFIKVISDSSTDIIVGIHMIGEGALEMAGTFVQQLEMVAKEEDIKFPTYAHPGINESLLEAVEGLIGQAIHIPPTKNETSTQY
ncbi:dihydrolipoyl dehydrogenase family protein [Sporosarcina sp. G11-34]|uniref:dihydrolipoyl dehydrogenase family protein n=1 Tax=Sporosarcina sp. G11-34 TaxID=2849605 RepID=UPI0022A92A1C|nr:FAD-dependent oxidoreductase [Sporosarcina sp. G11-34]MCZ2260867.1 FAD-dependent oxidoreductase [Sporosarcina sp. G11-34]